MAIIGGIHHFQTHPYNLYNPIGDLNPSPPKQNSITRSTPVIQKCPSLGARARHGGKPPRKVPPHQQQLSWRSTPPRERTFDGRPIRLRCWWKKSKHVGTWSHEKKHEKCMGLWVSISCSKKSRKTPELWTYGRCGLDWNHFVIKSWERWGQPR